ncbi:MAG: ribosome maturation factor RimP [Bacillota bacterium]|jgi:ribosome maturation factor RimP
MRLRGLEDDLFMDFEPLVREMNIGVDVLDVEFIKENKRRILRVTIYSPDGITLDHCARVQKVLSERLDVLDPIPDAYDLEVSSPGLERTLRRDKEFCVFKGSLCQANLFAPVDGKRTFQGTLAGTEIGQDGEPVIVLKTRQGLVTLPRKNVARVRLVYDPKPRKGEE